MRDDDLKSQFDYSEGQRDAASRVLIEVTNILNEYQDDIMVVGGWVPELLFPGHGHVGTTDVDLLLNHLRLKESSYLSIEKILSRNKYKKHPDKYFTFTKSLIVDNVRYDVDLDILAGEYGGTIKSRRSQHVQGLKALKATGGDFAFKVPPVELKMSACRPDGMLDTVCLKVVSIVPFLVMKAAALGRGKPKDAYDIYFCIRHYPGGVKSLASEFRSFRGHSLVMKMVEKMNEKFASPEHAGPADVVSFLDIHDKEEIEMAKRDVFEQIASLLEYIA